MSDTSRALLSGDEAVALAAHHAGVALASAYPGTPSTEILERLSELGGKAQWAPNEKVAYEVALGAAFAGSRALVTMKHVGLNVAADPLFTSTYTGVSGALVVISCDDPGMASSQNEQDNRRYAVAAGIPMLEPATSQEAYDFFFEAIAVSERWKMPVPVSVDDARVPFEGYRAAARDSRYASGGAFRARREIARDDSRICAACAPASPREACRNAGLERDFSPERALGRRQESGRSSRRACHMRTCVKLRRARAYSSCQ